MSTLLKQIVSVSGGSGAQNVLLVGKPKYVSKQLSPVIILLYYLCPERSDIGWLYRPRSVCTMTTRQT